MSSLDDHFPNDEQMGVSKNRGGPPKSSILIGFSIIFTIHFGEFPPIFGNTQMSNKVGGVEHQHQPSNSFRILSNHTFQGGWCRQSGVGSLKEYVMSCLNQNWKY